MIKKTREDLQTDNWYYTQMFFEEDAPLYCIVFAKTPELAKIAGSEYAKSKIEKVPKTINLYHKNYKVDARRMVDLGEYKVYSR